MSTYEKFTKDVGVIGLTNLVLTLRGLILLPIIAKILGPSGYGTWSLALVTLGLVTPIAEMGLSTALVRFLAAEKSTREIQEGFFSVLSAMLCCGTAIGLILFFLANFLANTLFGDASTLPIIQVIAIIVPVRAINTVCLAFFMAFRQMKTYSLFILLRNLGEIALIAGLVLSGFGIFGAVLSLLIASLFTTGVALYMIVSQIGIKRPDFHYLKSYLKFGLPLLPTNFFGWIVGMSDRYVIGYFLGITSVGIYSAAYSLGSFLSHFRVPLTRVLPPTLSKSYDEGKDAEVQSYLSYSLKYLLMLTVPAVFGLSLLGKQILRIFTTAEFIPSGYLVIPFVALSMLFFGIYATTGAQILRLAKKTNILGAIWGIGGLVNLGLNLVFVPRFGILAAAATTLFAYALASGLTLYFSFRELTFKVDWAFIVKSLAASGVMSLVILSLNPVKTWEVFLIIGLGAVIYGIVLFLLRGFTRSEVKFFTRFVRENLRMIIP